MGHSDGTYAVRDAYDRLVAAGVRPQALFLESPRAPYQSPLRARLKKAFDRFEAEALAVVDSAEHRQVVGMLSEAHA